MCENVWTHGRPESFPFSPLNVALADDHLRSLAKIRYPLVYDDEVIGHISAKFFERPFTLMGLVSRWPPISCLVPLLIQKVPGRSRYDQEFESNRLEKDDEFVWIYKMFNNIRADHAIC